MSVLSNELASLFAKVTNDSNNTKTESTVYGTVVVSNGTTYVKLDGSEVLTPVSTTTSAKDGERVTVMIKNHTATITGNMSSPSASSAEVANLSAQVTKVSQLVANTVTTESLEAERARIDELVADNVTIKNSLTATEANISLLQTDNITINEKLTAATADIDSLKTNKLDAETADIKYASIDKLTAAEARIYTLEVTYADVTSITTEFLEANYAKIDFANVEKASIGTMFANVGLISDATIVDGHVTGYLDSVEVNADKITAGTLAVDRLIFRGSEDSIIYELNNVTGALQAVQGDTLNGEILTDRSITVDKIVAKSITANEIAAGTITTDLLNVNEIFANDAVIVSLTSNEAFINSISSNSIVVGAASDAAKEAVESIKIGGNNLLLGTKDWSYGLDPASIVDETYKGFSVAYYDASSISGYADVGNWGNVVDAESDTEYTLSFYAKGTGSIRSYFYTGSVVASGISSGGNTTTSSDGSILHELTDDWKYYWVTWKTRSDASGLKSVIAARTFSGNTIYICGVKFEKGNVATAWSPHSSDSTANWRSVKDTTLIDGGKIYANSITANQVNVDSLFTVDINATGTITGATINGAYGNFTKGFDVLVPSNAYPDTASFYISNNSSNVSLGVKASTSDGSFPGANMTFRMGTVSLNSTYNMTLNSSGGISLNGGAGDITIDTPLTASDIVEFKGKVTFSKSVVCAEFKYPVVFSCTNDAASGSANGPALTIGGSSTTAHIEIDNNEILAKANASSLAPLYFNEQVVADITNVTFRPHTNLCANLGTSSYRWATIYGRDLNVSYTATIGTTLTAGTSITTPLLTYAGTLRLGTHNSTTMIIQRVGSYQLRFDGDELYHCTSDAGVANVCNLGSASYRFGNCYFVNLNLSGTLSVSGAISCSGGLELYHSTPFIDFHYGNSAADHTMRLIASATNVLDLSGSFRPGADNTYTLGQSSRRWSSGYIYMLYYTSQSQTSDRRLKKDITDIDARYLQLWDLIAPKKFKFLTEEKYSLGIIAQDLEASMSVVGLEEDDCSFLHKHWTESEDYTGYEYGVDYTFISILTYCKLKSTIEIINNHETRIKELETQLEKALNTIEQLQVQNG